MSFAFTFGDAAADGSLYVVGVHLGLEDQDVRHAILWERLGGEWKRYSWNNRVYDVVAYPNTGALLGSDGALKVRSQVHGSSVQQLEVSDDAPSSLRSVRRIRRIGDELFVVGMRRMVYRRARSKRRCGRGSMKACAFRVPTFRWRASAPSMACRRSS